MKSMQLRKVFGVTYSQLYQTQRRSLWKHISTPSLTRLQTVKSSQRIRCTIGNMLHVKSSLSKPLDSLVYCRKCGNKMQVLIPQGDSKERHICSSCGYIDYQNPKMIVGCIAEHENKILLCSRGIQPCKGLWTLPAGFLEIGESSADGAARETLEEANAAVAIISMFSMIDIPIIGQSYVIFRAKLLEPFTHSPGHETIETKLFEPNDIPYDKIAFSSVAETLKAYVQDSNTGDFRFHHGVISKKLGAPPNAPSAFKFENHIIH